jgi:hypothetical protein
MGVRLAVQGHGASERSRYRPSGGTLNEARDNVGIALSNLIHSQPTQEKIDKAKSAIQTWIQELEAAKP